MSFTDQISWSFRHSKKQLVESFLVILAIALGIGVIVTVLSLLLSVSDQFDELIKEDHFRILQIMSKVDLSRSIGAPLVLLGDEFPEKDWSATLLQLEELQRNLPAQMHVFVEEIWWTNTPLLVDTDQQSEEDSFLWNTNDLFLTGTTPTYFKFKGFSLARGNWFLPEDVRDTNQVVVLSNELAQLLFGTDDPLGKDIPLEFGTEREFIFTVIGVLNPPVGPKNDYLAFRNARTAYVPASFSPYSFEADVEKEFSTISIGVDSGMDLIQAQEVVQSEIALLWGEDANVQNTLTEFLATQKQMQRYAVLIGIFASVGLIIAVLNILNLMLARVLKRTKSIGLSMALGSSRWMVFQQFLVEALFLGIVGSGLGVLLSFSLGSLLNRALGTTVLTAMAQTKIFSGIAIGLVASLFFGVYPAYVGSRTNPVNALRTD